MIELRTKASSSNKAARSTFPLPEEIIFLILVQLPDDVIYHYLRFVCRQWYNIINMPHFIQEHLLLLRSCTGLLSQLDTCEVPTYTTFGESTACVTDTHLPCGAEICSTCDGLAVVRLEDKVYVVNLLTKETMHLPPTNARMGYCHMYDFTLVASRSTNNYKVFLTYHLDNASPLCCVFITLGKDYVWRPVNGVVGLSDSFIGSTRTVRQI